jgi:hypothetical protein
LGSRSAAGSVLKADYSTVAEHIPAAHRAHAQWTPGKLITWAASIGAATAAWVTRLFQGKAHPEHGYRACLGLMRLAREVGHVRMEAACTRAMAIRINSAQLCNNKLSTVSKLNWRFPSTAMCAGRSTTTEFALSLARPNEKLEMCQRHWKK